MLTLCLRLLPIALLAEAEAILVSLLMREFYLVVLSPYSKYLARCSFLCGVTQLEPNFRLSSILVSQFILNLRQVNHSLAHCSDPSISLDVQLSLQTQSGQSLPRSLAPFGQLVHVDNAEEDIEDETALSQVIDENEEFHMVLGSVVEI